MPRRRPGEAVRHWWQGEAGPPTALDRLGRAKSTPIPLEHVKLDHDVFAKDGQRREAVVALPRKYDGYALRHESRANDCVARGRRSADPLRGIAPGVLLACSSFTSSSAIGR
jgi:hypothetical protein